MSTRTLPGGKELPAFFFIVEKNYYKYKKGLGNAHPAFRSKFLQTSYSIAAVSPHS
jgi:hypothetical protein